MRNLAEPKPNRQQRRPLAATLQFIAAALLLSLFGALSAPAQDKGNEHSADSTLKGGGRVNPSTLAMEFDLGLGSYPGRGINVPVSLSYSSKLWRLESDGQHPVPAGNSSSCYQHYIVKYSEDSASGWTTSLAAPYIEYTGMQTYYNYDGSPVNFGDLTCPSSQGGNETYPLKYIRRLMVRLPSGETHEMRASDTPVEFTWASSNQNRPDILSNWNGTYHAADGSNIVYVQNSSSSTYRLLMPDGSYYDFSSSSAHGSDRPATKFTDRNGNFTTFHAPGSTDPNGVVQPNGYWTDTVGRVLPVPLAPSAPGQPTTAQSPQLYKLPGLGGTASVEYKLHWKRLKGASQAESALTNYNDNLRQVGDVYACTNGNGDDTQCLYPSTSTDILFSGGGESSSSPRLFGENGEDDFNPVVLKEIELPNGTSYSFSYDIYGRIERITYPTGGIEKFVYDVVDTLSELEPDDVSGITNFGVVDRKLFYEDPAANPDSSYHWTYSTEYVAPRGFKVTTIRPDGTKTSRYLHRGYGANDQSGFGYDNGLAGMQYKSESFDRNGAPVSQSLSKWTVNSLSVPYIGNKADWNPRVTHEETYAYDPSNSSNFVRATQKYEYENESALNQPGTPLLRKRTLQYGFESSSGGGGFAPVPNASATPDPNPTPVPSGTPATLIRSSEVTYLINDTSLSQSVRDSYYKISSLKNMVGLVTAESVRDASGTVVSASKAVYDESGSSPAVGRGNPTTSLVWDSTKGVVSSPSAYISTHAKFDGYGNRTEATDANGSTSVTTYQSGLYPVSVASEVPDPTGANGSDSAITTSAAFDWTTGLPLTTTDANGVVTKIEYETATLRPVEIIKGYGLSNAHHTETEYDDQNRTVTVRSEIDGTNWAEATSTYDLLGRTFKTETSNKNGAIFVEKEFYDDGKVKRVSNPFRSGDTQKWTTTYYDDAGRPVSVELPDGATVQTSYGVSLSGVVGTAKEVTDQAGKKRRGISDALGRMVRVIEDPAGVAYSTDYVFDVPGNLRETIQGAQHRYFMHDSIGRLLYSKMPEEEANTAYSGTGFADPITGNSQWATKYTYDDNGAILTVTDARNSTVSATYDAIGRIVKRDYSDTTMPDVDFFYDGRGLPSVPSNSLGQTTAVKSSVSETRYTSFDDFGRLLTHEQRTTAGQLAGTENPYLTAYAYNLSGAVVSETYPSGRVISHAYDEDGILDVLSGTKPGQTGSKVYLSDITYNASGNIESMRLGNGLWETADYNDRQQITSIGLGYSAGNQSLLDISLEYGTASQNNGSLMKQTVSHTGLASPIEQSYTYDGLNRLKSAEEKYNNGASQSWKQTFSYDRYGNREFDAANTTTLASNGKVENPDIEESTNRIKKDQDGGGIDYDYDKNGNLTLDAENKRMVYDAENRLKQFFRGTNGGSTPDAVYQYDGEGKRVRKIADGTETVFVYNAGGKLVAEYSNQTVSNPQSSYLTTDHLGSPRVVTDALGNIRARHDYLAYGEDVTEKLGNVGGRTAAMKYGGSDGVRKQYTGYEKDDESGLDFAQARYYSSLHGRYTGVDPLTASADTRNPQTFNRYSYVLNSPYKFTDPLGLIASNTGACGQWCPQSRTWGSTLFDNMDNRDSYFGKRVEFRCYRYVCDDGSNPSPSNAVSQQDGPYLAADGTIQGVSSIVSGVIVDEPLEPVPSLTPEVFVSFSASDMQEFEELDSLQRIGETRINRVWKSTITMLATDMDGTEFDGEVSIESSRGAGWFQDDILKTPKTNAEFVLGQLTGGEKSFNNDLTSESYLYDRTPTFVANRFTATIVIKKKAGWTTRIPVTVVTDTAGNVAITPVVSLLDITKWKRGK
ncbi:MAG: RHS repeat-associated core domain-containing protein [Pyrinomonadaceae bacterium]